MRRLFLVAGVTVTALIFISQSKSAIDPTLVPVRTILTVEAQQDHATNVPILHADDVTAHQQNQSLRVTNLTPFSPPNAGLDLFLLIDDSSSTRLGSQLDDLRQFIQAQPATTKIGLGYMHNGTVDVVEHPSGDHSGAAKELRLPMGRGGPSPSPYLSLSELIKQWHANSARREIVMVSSGIDPLGGLGSINTYLDAAIGDAQRNGIVVYAIYMPEAGHGGHSFFLVNWGQNHLAELAEETGGEAYMLGLTAPVALMPYLNQISAHLEHQYAATIMMKPETKAGFRSLRFTTEVPNAAIVAPARVYVRAEDGAGRD
jgi:hypothetical protein